MTWHSGLRRSSAGAAGGPDRRRGRTIATLVALAAITVPLAACGPRPSHRDAGNPVGSGGSVSDAGATVDDLDDPLQEIDDALSDVDATLPDADS